MKSTLTISFLVITTTLVVVNAVPLNHSKYNGTTIGFSLSASDLTGCGWLTRCTTSVLVRYSSIYTDWKQHGKTRTIRNNNNPVWPEAFTFEHEPGTSQRWRLDLREHGLISSKVIATFTVHVDEYALLKEDIVLHEIPDGRGVLSMHRIKD